MHGANPPGWGCAACITTACMVLLTRPIWSAARRLLTTNHARQARSAMPANPPMAPPAEKTRGRGATGGGIRGGGCAQTDRDAQNR